MTAQGAQKRQVRKLLRHIDATLMSDSLQPKGRRPTSHGTQIRFQLKLWHWLVVAFLILTVLAASVPGSREYMLRRVGRLIVADQPTIESAEIIVVAIDADGAGTLEAADLVHRGVSRRVAVFDDPPSSVDREFLRRGLPYEDWAAISTRQLQSLGVQSIEQIPKKASGSEQEGDILPGWCDKQGYHSVVLVTSPDHSRRLSRILRRSFHNRQTRIAVDSSPYAEFEPDSWWKTRAGLRNGIVEFEKLILDVIRHPFS
jgi:uncharacterized SAM-binding protein YcdF (DUF218 family)